MADRTLTINHADGGSETYTLKTEDVLGVRSMQVDGETVTVDRTAPDLVRTIIADGQTITIDTTREGVRTLTVDGTEITLDRTEEANLNSFLEQFTGASAAYSLRDLASISGDTTVVRVRRSSDNAEADFSAKEVSDGTLVTWVGAGNDGFVETWYDQSGNGNDAVQEVAGSQPKIVDAGVLVSGGIEFDGVDDRFVFSAGRPITSIDAASAFFVGSSDSSANQCGLFLSSASTSKRFYFPVLNSGIFKFGYANNISAVILASPDTSEHIFTGIAGASTASGYYDGELKGIAASGTGVSGGQNIGSIGTGYRWDGRMREIIIYPSDQSANREAIETNINNQYDIY